jgi:hypothetical protein
MVCKAYGIIAPRATSTTAITAATAGTGDPSGPPMALIMRHQLTNQFISYAPPRMPSWS